jgi:hypothetical protein
VQGSNAAGQCPLLVQNRDHDVHGYERLDYRGRGRVGRSGTHVHRRPP